MLIPPDRKCLIWQDLVEAKNLLEAMRGDPDAPIKITDEYLKDNFVYMLIRWVVVVVVVVV